MRDLETPRLILEAVTPRNAIDLWQIMQAPHLRDYQDVPRFTRTEHLRRVGARASEFSGRAVGRFEWIVRVRASAGEPIGWVSLRLGDQPRGIAELGYTLVVNGRGRGYATEAVSAVSVYAFETPGIEAIEACCLPQNLRSRRLLERLGFNLMRSQPNGAMLRGRPVEIAIYRLRGHPAQRSSANSIVTSASAKPK